LIAGNKHVQREVIRDFDAMSLEGVRKIDVFNVTLKIFAFLLRSVFALSAHSQIKN
jgi:hypothetical protein